MLLWTALVACSDPAATPVAPGSPASEPRPLPTTAPPPAQALEAPLTVRLAGPEVVLALAGDLAPVFGPLGLTIEGVVAEGGGQALGALAGGTADCALLGRDLRQDEGGFAAAVVGYDAVVFVVAAGNPVEGLEVEQLAGLYDGSVDDWSRVGGAALAPVRYARPANKAVTRRVDAAGVAPGSVVALVLETDGEVLAAVRGEAGGIGYVSRSSLRADPDGLRALKVGGIAPDDVPVASGAYPLSLPLAVVSTSPPPAPCAALTALLSSSEGQAVLARRFSTLRGVQP